MLGCPHDERSQDAFHMVVNLCQVFALVREQGHEKVRLPQEDRWASHCQKFRINSRAYESMGSCPNSANKYQ